MSSSRDSETGQQAKQDFERAKSEASHLASTAADVARQRGKEGIERAKDRTADRADELADVIEATADDIESADGNEMVSGYGRSMASMMRRFAGGLREHEIEEFAGQLAGFARRNPGSFLAGSFALGFGLSRFLKATSARRSDYSDESGEYAMDELDDEYEEELFLEEEEEIDMTLEPAPSPEVSTYEAGEPWPEDRGNERPGAASPVRHETIAVSESTSEYPSGATGEPASGRSDAERRSETERQNETRRDTSGGTDRE